MAAIISEVKKVPPTEKHSEKHSPKNETTKQESPKEPSVTNKIEEKEDRESVRSPIFAAKEHESEDDPTKMNSKA
jgi:hypothetical protein